jgi:pimeloyl-[acyl-carrier protein] methyl ester esterase
MKKVFTLHGWSFDGSIWSISPFKEAIHLTLPGHGDSPFESTDILCLSREVGKFIPESSTFVGWSLGASVAVMTAIFYPEKVEKLILYAPTSAFSGVSQPEVVVKRFLRKLKRDFMETVYYFRGLCSSRDWLIPPLHEEKARKLLESFAWFDLAPHLRKITVPVIVLAGEEDSVTGLEGAFSLWSELRNCTLNVVPERDHLTILEM